MRALQISDETSMFTSAVPIPTIGNLAVNSYLIRGEQPTLIDTGITPEVPDFDVALRDLIDPVHLRWIVVTHADRDHVGALTRLLAEAPNATVVTSFTTFGVMSVGSEPIPPERAFLVTEDSTLDIGDRTLRANRPPFFDNPGTLAFYDPKQSILFSSDCFGSPSPPRKPRSPRTSPPSPRMRWRPGRCCGGVSTARGSTSSRRHGSPRTSSGSYRTGPRRC